MKEIENKINEWENTSYKWYHQINESLTIMLVVLKESLTHQIWWCYFVFWNKSYLHSWKNLKARLHKIKSGAMSFYRPDIEYTVSSKLWDTIFPNI